MAAPGHLKQSLLESGNPVLAVVDGAQFDDLPRDLLGIGFFHKALYLDRGDGNRDRVATAPQLVWLDRRAGNGPPGTVAVDGPPDPQILQRLLMFVGARPAAVFWECEAGGEALYRHLRAINMVRIPRHAIPENPFATSVPATETHGAVLFRHADANVMAQVLPALNTVQITRVLGPANAVLFAPDADWTDGAKAIVINRPRNPPPVPAGMLQLEDWNMSLIDAARTAMMRKQAIGELADRDPDKSVRVGEAFDRASTYGLGAKDHIWSFIELDLLHGRSFERSPRFRAVLEHLEDEQLTPAVKIQWAQRETTVIAKGGMQ
ncbi:DUF4123 domain-containing protein [Rhizobium terrae]|uniref:DUF4123 domain-containing protein n=1 Tax=Rhizobium terrae TaxID=2171756 RepID=UPI0013C2E20A|nr:DUF4123 domain-containing protein [Rhizobium terrae]